MEGHNEISPQPSLLWAEQARLPQPFVAGEVLQPSVHLRGPPLGLSNGLLSFLSWVPAAWAQYCRWGRVVQALRVLTGT